MRRAVILLLTLVGLAGCGSVFPDALLRGVDRSLTLGVLRGDPERYRQARVVLAGEIIATRPTTGPTEIEVLARPLGESDAPRAPITPTGASWWWRRTSWIPPSTRAAGGSAWWAPVTGTQERPLGERSYPYVVIRPDQIYLWARDFAGGPYPYAGPYPYYCPYWPYYW